MDDDSYLDTGDCLAAISQEKERSSYRLGLSLIIDIANPAKLAFTIETDHLSIAVIGSWRTPPFRNAATHRDRLGARYAGC